MGNTETPHCYKHGRWYKITYSKGDGSPNFEENVQGINARQAIESLRYDRERVGQKLTILYVWENVDPSLYEEAVQWVRNVQHLRVEFPPIQDETQDEEACVLARMIEAYMKQRFLGYKTEGIVSLGGFYRGDHDWDNIDQQGSCVNSPNRGSGENEP